MKKKATIIIPCAGRSSRYPNLRPKFFLVNPNGNLMIIDAISKLELEGCSIVAAVLREHDRKYGIAAALKKFFPKYDIRVCIIDKPTQSQSETVYRTLQQAKIKGPFLVKDADNIFKLDAIAENFNYVTVESLENAGLVNASNKSYVQCDSSGVIAGIEEKKVISNTFSVGGYYFLNPKEFISAFENLSNMRLGKEIYVSSVISYLILKKKKKFKIKLASEYLDLGTIKEWKIYKKNIRTYFVDIDGVIVYNSGEYSKPYWGTSRPLAENTKALRELYDHGNQIILTTSRKEQYREITEKQLTKIGVKYHRLVMGLFQSGRVLVNDFSNSNPYPSAIAINIPRDSDELGKYLNI